jgi:hypothetical protein
MSLTTTAPTPATPVTPREAIAEDAFAGGLLRRKVAATGAWQDLEPTATTAEDADGEITVTLEADLNPAHAAADVHELVDEDGERWACDYVAAGEAESHEYTFGNLRRLPGRRTLPGAAFTSTAPTAAV